MTSRPILHSTNHSRRAAVGEWLPILDKAFFLWHFGMDAVIYVISQGDGGP